SSSSLMNRQSLTSGPLNSDPWCLTCGETVREMGEAGDKPYAVPLRRHRDNELCEIFSRVLGVRASEAYASDCVCHRCERQLRRLGRYSNIILARREASQIREQLERNLARHGQVVVESGEQATHSDGEDEGDDNTSTCSGSTFSTGCSGRGRSHESPLLYNGRKLLCVGAISSRSSSLSSIPSEASIDESAERELELQEASRSSSYLQLHHKALSPVYDEGELRREARRRKLSVTSLSGESDRILDSPKNPLPIPTFTTEVFLTKSDEDSSGAKYNISGEIHSLSGEDSAIPGESDSLRCEDSVLNSSSGEESKSRVSDLRDEYISKTNPDPASLDINLDLQKDISTRYINLSETQQGDPEGTQLTPAVRERPPDPPEETLDTMESGEDKSKLVERSESLDQSDLNESGSSKREKFKKRSKFFSLSFKSSDKKKKSKAEKAAEKFKKKGGAEQAAAHEEDGAPAAQAQSPESGPGSCSSPGADNVKDNDADASTPIHWSGRVNPFDNKKSDGADGNTTGTETSETMSPTSPKSPVSILTDNSDQNDFVEDDLFGKGIVDLDDDDATTEGKEQASAPPPTSGRSDSIQADEELLKQIEKTGLTQVVEIPPSGNSSRQPSIDVAEMEEQVTLKSQFKGAFYNIGSTEDLLQEFANEEEAKKLK
ncbi:hypothetical protein EGW08_017307, partial [Elysia chlorotica]